MNYLLNLNLVARVDPNCSIQNFVLNISCCLNTKGWVLNWGGLIYHPNQIDLRTTLWAQKKLALFYAVTLFFSIPN